MGSNGDSPTGRAEFDILNPSEILTDRFQFAMNMVLQGFGFAGIIITGVFEEDGEIGVMSAGLSPGDGGRVSQFTKRISETVSEIADEFQIPKRESTDA